MPPDLHLLSLAPVRGPNYWSRRPVVRMDVEIGALDDVSSADVDGLPEALVGALPTLGEHRCSVGRPGGFVERLRRGTYAPHIAEHVALALQAEMGHDVGFGQTRGGEREGTYTIVFAHRHEQVGVRAGPLALDLVRRAFEGALTAAHADAARDELRALALTPAPPPLALSVHAIVVGGAARAEAARLLRAGLPGATDRAVGDAPRDEVPHADVVVELEPAALLAHGLPCTRARAALLLDDALEGVAERWRESDRAARLLGVACDALEATRGLVVAPADARELHAEASARTLPLATFARSGDADEDARRAAARAMAWLADAASVPAGGAPA